MSPTLNPEELQRALKDYDEAIRLDPQDAEVYFKRGTTCCILGRLLYERAIGDFD
jgi:tetratricopeptide (TPR) repeat protein